MELGFRGGEAAVKGNKVRVIIVARGRTGRRHKTLRKHDRERPASAGLEVLDLLLLLGRHCLFLQEEEGSVGVDVQHLVLGGRHVIN